MAKYTTNIPVTITLAGLAKNATATSSIIDNTMTQYDSADFAVTVKLGSGASPVPTRIISVGIIGSADGGITFDSLFNEEVSLKSKQFLNNASLTLLVNTQQILFGSGLPAFWKLWVRNDTGAAFNSTPSNFSVTYTGVRDTDIADALLTVPLASDTFSTHQVSVSNLASQIIASNPARNGLSFANVGSHDVYLGNYLVTTSTGYVLPSGGTFTFPSPVPGTSIYGVTTTGTTTVELMEW